MRLEPEPLQPVGVGADPVELLRRLGLLLEVDDPAVGLSIRMMPHDRASASATGSAAMVTSALFSTWVRIMSWKSIR